MITPIQRKVHDRQPVRDVPHCLYRVIKVARLVHCQPLILKDFRQ
jgi:hypothetical protein